MNYKSNITKISVEKDNPEYVEKLILAVNKLDTGDKDYMVNITFQCIGSEYIITTNIKTSDKNDTQIQRSKKNSK